MRSFCGCSPADQRISVSTIALASRLRGQGGATGVALVEGYKPRASATLLIR